MTKEFINKVIKIRDKNRLRVNKGLLDEEEYKIQRNKTKKMIRKAQENYYKKLFDDKHNGMKQMWNHLGTMLNPKRIKGPLMIKRITSEGKYITDNSEIAETLNKHFCTVGKNLAAKVPNPKSSFKQFLKAPIPNSIFIDKITPTEVIELINGLDSRKSPGIDEIPNKALKVSAEVIALPLTHIINQSYSVGIFP